MFCNINKSFFQFEMLVLGLCHIFLNLPRVKRDFLTHLVIFRFFSSRNVKSFPSLGINVPIILFTKVWTCSDHTIFGEFCMEICYKMSFMYLIQVSIIIWILDTCKSLCHSPWNLSRFFFSICSIYSFFYHSYTSCRISSCLPKTPC